MSLSHGYAPMNDARRVMSRFLGREGSCRRSRGPEELAREILLRAGVETRPALPALRVVALRALLGGAGVPLAYLRPERLPDVRSYAEAIARTIADLEFADLAPADLRAAAGNGGIPEDPVLPDRLRDIA